MAARESSSPQDTVVQPHFDLEALEPRLLLTALVGGEVFHFQDAENQRVAISVTGNVVVEIVGATMNPENDVLLHELPGEFIQSTLGRAGFRVAGGYGAEDGVMPVNGDNDTGALTHLLDGAGTAFNPLTAFHEDIAFNAIAANKAGDTYGINFYSTVTLFGETQIVELVQFDNATGTAHVIADLGGRIATRVTPWGDPAVELVGVSAADFNPVEDDSDTAGDSWLYFVVQAGDDEMDYLFRVNVGAGNPTQIAQTVERAATNNTSNPQTIVDPNGNLPDLVIAPGAALWGAEPDFEDNEGDLTITAIVFDERDNGDASRDLDDVVMYYYVTGGDQGFRQGGISSINLSMRPGTGLRRVDTSQPDTDLSWRSRTVVAFEDPAPRSPLDNITGIELVTDDPTQFEQFLWAVEGDGGSLRHVDIDGPNPGFAEDWGPLPDPQDDDLADGDTQRGQALGDLAWNDTLLNPFTGSLGALMATDVDSDDLVFVDHRQRFPNTDAFIVFVTQGDPNGSITFTRVLDNGEDAVVRFTLELWDDSVENFRIVGENDPIAVPGDTGGVLIGVLTADINPNINNEDLRVIWEGSISSDHYDDNGAIGAFPVGFDGLHPGVLVARSLLEYVSAAPNLTDRLLGNNLDNIGEMAISGDGSTLAVIDRDARDENGNALATPADQLAFVNPLTGKASTVGVSIMAGATPLTGVQGLDYGDPDFDGVEALYAIYDVLGTLTLGTIDTNTGAFTALGALGAGMTEVQAMAFSPDQRLWIVGYNSGTGVSTLYQINPANGATVAVIGILRDAETGENLANIGSMDFATSASFGNPPYRLLAHDRYNGRLVDIALSTSTILGTDYALVGANTATEDGSLRPTVGAITYDRANNRFFAVDNATGISPLDDESGAESAVLMRLTGFASDSAVQQDLGRLLIGGTVTGRIDISGTIDQFQVGWLALGNLFAQANPWGDFHVGGDMHSFIARAPIGYYAFNDTVSRARVQIDGRLGYFLNPGQLAGSLTVSNSPSFVNTSYLTERYFEIETLVNGLRPDVLATRIGDQILQGYTANDSFVYNDTFDDAQFLAAVRSGVTGANSTRVSGRLFVDLLEEPQEDDDVIDPIDYYAVALMAGQQVLVQLITTSSSTGEALHVGVIDPNGHVLASDYSNVYPGSFGGQPFAFTATEPGVYIFAVAHPGDWNFNGIQDPGEEDFDTRADWVDAHYDLRIQQIGNLALGGLKAEPGEQGDGDMTTVITVSRGDLGYVSAFDEMLGSISVLDGNLRAIEAGELDSWIDVPRGSVGRITTTLPPTPNNLLDDSNFVFIRPIGGDFQLIEILGDAAPIVQANGGIGVIRIEGDLEEGAVFFVDVDRHGADGIIELIDVGGNYKGAALDTGIGGDIRFIRVEGEVWNDPFFGISGSGSQSTTSYNFGQSVMLTDDGGTRLSLNTAEIDNPFYHPVLNPTAPPKLGLGSMEVTTVSVRSGGVVVVNVEVIGIAGLNIAAVDNGAFDISRVEFSLIARDDAPDDDPYWHVPLAINGPQPISVYEITGNENTAFSTIINNTQGQLINGLVESVDRIISLGTIGLADGRTGMPLAGRSYLSSGVERLADARDDNDLLQIFPFISQRNGFVVRRSDALDTPNTVSLIQASKGLGNILVAGNIGQIIADADRNFDINDGVFEGVAGPIWAVDDPGDDIEEGSIGSVQIGEGIAPSGSGEVVFAGVYADASIGQIIGPANANIMGDVAVGGSIGSVTLNGGSIINADLMAGLDRDGPQGGLAQSREMYSRFYAQNGSISSITVHGDGGLIGTLVQAPTIGTTSVVSGFGIINSAYGFLSGGSLGNITVGGFGIRGSSFSGGATTGNITVNGTGAVLDTSNFDAAVARSAFGAALPFGHAIGILSDLDTALGALPDLRSGVIDNSTFEGTRDVGQVFAWQITDSHFHYANSAAGFRTTSEIDNVEIVTGSLGYFQPGSNVSSLTLTFSGRLATLTIKGNLDGNSRITATGPNGNVGTMTVTGNLDGDIDVYGTVATISVGGNLTGNITIDGNGATTYALNQLLLGGSLVAGSLDIDGNVNLIRANGSLGSVGDTLTIHGNLNQLQVGVSGAEAVLATSLIVLGNLGTLTVTGTITGDILIQGNLSSMTVTTKAKNYRGMAVDATGRTLAIDSTTNVDRIVAIDPATGAATLIGTVKDLSGNTYTGHVRQLAFDNAGKLYAIVSDVNGNGAGAAGAALVQIEATDGDGDGVLLATNPTHTGFNGVLIDGGAVTADFTALAVDFLGRVWAIRRDGLVDTLVRLNVAGAGAGATVSQTVVGAVKNGAANTKIVGMGFSSTTALETLVGTASSGSPLVFTAAGGQTVTVTVLGAGNVELYDEGGVGTDTDNLIDALRLDGTDSTTVITITTSIPGSVNIGRVLATAGSVAGSFSFDGQLIENLVAVSANGATATLLQININAPSASTVLTPAGTIDGKVDAFAVGRSGVFFDTFAYDTNGVVGGRFYASAAATRNPIVRVGSMTDAVTGDVTASGNFGAITITGGNVTGDFNALGTGGTFRLTNGNMGGDLISGGTLANFILTAGDVLAGVEITSSLGDITQVQINGGDLLGAVRSPFGRVGTLSILGSDMGPLASVEAASVGTLRVDNDVKAGATINVTGDLTTLQVRGDVEVGASITAGSASTIDVDGDLAGNVTIGYKAGQLYLYVDGDLGSAAGLISIASDLYSRILGNVIAGTTISLARNLTYLAVTGTFAGDLFVARAATTLTFGAIANAVLTFGFDVATLTTTVGGITGSLIHAGVDRGGGATFAGGESRRGKIGTLTTKDVTDSIITAGGDVTRFTSTSMTNSTLTAGLTLAGAALDSVISGVLDLTVAADRDTARSGGTLLRGDVGTFSGGTMTASQVVAGVDPGDGDFMTAGDNTVANSQSGGASKVASASGVLDANSAIIADAGITDRTSGVGKANNTPNVGYVLADITVNNPLAGAAVGVAASGTPLSYVTVGGHRVTITVTGAGTVTLYDEAGGGDSNDVIDALVLTGTTAATTVRITTSTPGAVGLGRVLALDDATVSSFIFDGDVVGDGTDDADIWFDGSVPTLTIRDLGDGVSGKIGGDVTTMTLRGQGSGAVFVGGKVATLKITESASSGILETLTGAAAGLTNVTEIAIDSGGLTWVFDGTTGELARVDLTAVPNATVVQGPFTVTDLFDGSAIDVLSMDFTAADLLMAIAKVRDPSPTVRVGTISANAIALRGMAIDSSGQIYAIDSSSGFDRLVKLNPTSGAVEDVGQLRDPFTNSFTNHILGIAFDINDNLLAVIEDRDGNGGAFAPGHGAALAKIEVTDANGNGFLDVSSPTNSGLPPVLLNDGGAVTNAITAMAVDANGLIWAVIRSGVQDIVVNITTAGVVSIAGANPSVIKIGGADTNVAGFGFDDLGNLIAFDNVSGAMIKVDQADPAASTYIGTVGSVNSTLDAFVLAGYGATMSSYAYDTDDVVGGVFYKSSGATVAVLGSIDTTGGAGTGEFTRLLALAQDALGTPLSSNVVSVAVDTVGAGNIFVVTENSKLFEYDATGALVGGGAIGTITDASTGETLQVTQIDFNAAGELVGVDTTFQRLVTIDTATGQATPRLDKGTAPGSDLAAFGFDPVADEFLAVRASTDAYARFLATTEAEFDTAVGGLTADSYTTITINGAKVAGKTYNGRITATNNTIGTVTLYGDFRGYISSASSITTFQQYYGVYEGSVAAGADINSFIVIPGMGSSGDFLNGGVVEAGGKLNSFDHRGAIFDGLVKASEAGSIMLRGSSGSNADVRIVNGASTIQSVGAYAGDMTVGSLTGSIIIQGLLGATSTINVGGAVPTLQFMGGTASGSVVNVGGANTSLTVSQTHAGQIAVRKTIGRAALATVTGGSVIAGWDLTTLTASGPVTNALLAAGTWVGADGLYNTADDVIYGGSITSASFTNTFTNSALVAGVLPALALGPGIPADPTAYTWDTASAGGIRASKIAYANFPKPSTGSAVAAADAITKLAGTFAPNLAARAFGGDPVTPVTLVDFDVVSGDTINLIFSEPIDASSLVLSIDLNNDGLLTGPGDVLGSLTLTDTAGNIVDTNISFSHTTQIDEHGRTQGVVQITRTGGFDASDVIGPFLNITLSGSLANPAIVDRSGMRSSLRDFNQDGTAAVGEDPLGSIFDGDGNRVEGGDATLSLVIAADSPDTFLDTLAGVAVNLVADGGSVSVRSKFNNLFDIDIYRFSATAYAFLSIQALGSTAYDYALFLQDDQGTTSLTDDTFELVVRFESSADSEFQVVELADSGEYFVAVTLSAGITAMPLQADYELVLTMASSDDMLDGVLDGSTGLPAAVQIAYVSNSIGDNNNLLGANPAKQLIYLNFDGGTTTRYAEHPEGNTTISAFDPSTISAALASFRSVIINGGTVNNTPIDGIVDNIVSIYQDTPASQPKGQLTVMELGADLSAYLAASTGLYFTTVNPALSGLDPAIDFSTVYIGDAPAGVYSGGLLGRANHVDTANLDKADEAFALASHFAGFPFSPSLTTQIAQVGRALANTIAHEIGHILGLRHQPTSGDFMLQTDDPANGLLAAMNSGAGVDNAAGLGDIRISTTAGTSFNVDLDGAVTVQDVVDLINVAGAGMVAASIDVTGSRIILRDFGFGADTLRVVSINGTTTAEDLGIRKDGIPIALAPGWTGSGMIIQGDAVLTIGEGNSGPGLMAYESSTSSVNELSKLGTLGLSSTEFPVGQIDTVDVLLNWLA